MSTTNLVSIVGAGHSGSTLLDLILGSHSQIWSTGEIENWDHYLTQEKVCACGKHPTECEFWSELIPEWNQFCENNGVPITITDTRSKTVEGAVNIFRHRCSLLLTLLFPMHKYPGLMNLLSRDFHHRASNVMTLFDLIRATSRRPVICDSSKSVYRFRLLHAHRPGQTKAIFLTRDGRAVVASHLRRPNTQLSKLAKSWRFTNIYTRLMLRTLPTDSYLHVRYEELCRQPDKTLNRICDFLGLAFEPSMLHFSGDTQHNIGGNRMRMSGLTEIREDVKWRAAMSKTQLEEFDRIAGKTNTRLLGEFFQN